MCVYIFRQLLLCFVKLFCMNSFNHNPFHVLSVTIPVVLLCVRIIQYKIQYSCEPCCFAFLCTGYLFWLCVLLLLLGLQERVPDSPSPAPSLEDHRRPGSHPSSHRSSSVSSSPAHTESSSDRIRTSLQTPRTFSTHFVCEQFMNHPAFLRPAAHYNGLSMNHALLGLSPNIPPGPKEGDLAHDMSHEAAAHKRNHTDKGESSSCHTFSALTGLRRPP